MSALFDPITIGGITLANRIVVSSMCQYSAIDGIAHLLFACRKSGEPGMEPQILGHREIVLHRVEVPHVGNDPGQIVGRLAVGPSAPVQFATVRRSEAA